MIHEHSNNFILINILDIFLIAEEKGCSDSWLSVSRSTNIVKLLIIVVLSVYICSNDDEVMNNTFIFSQMGLVLILTVVPTLQTARYGVDETIANVLAGFQIILSPDKHEVVKIVVYYIWCVEGEGNHKQPRAHWHKYHQYFCTFILIISANENSLNPSYADAPTVCYTSAMTLSCLVNMVLLMRSMVLHR